MGETAQSSVDSVLGKLVVDQGLASAEEVQDCVRQQRKLAASEGDGQQALSDKTLAALLVQKGLVTKRQIERLKPHLEGEKASRQIPGYQIIKKLGAGAMATVYLARQLSLDRLVAIKVLPKRSSENAEFVERFYAEGKAAGKLNHAHIVSAYDVGKAGEYHYFVMEYVEGRTVYDDLTKFGRYKEKAALDIVIQIARALDHAHKAGLIHRDLKPKNIMITAEGTAKLADMGLARAVSDREAAEAEQGKAYGTPYYISPEQIRGDIDVDYRCDLYGLGATFYHMVTGQVPYDGPNPSAVMHKHLKSELVPPDHVNPKLSAGVGEIIEVCMQKDRNMRYQSASDMLEDLEAVARGEAPMQARRQFDLGSLSALESTAPPTPAQAAANAATGVTGAAGNAANGSQPALTEQPLFWAAVAGWGVALLLLIIVIIMAAN
jgi:eukaryotic-like serine/threonine-protein kinase